jgi:hypothetical protein
LARAKGMEPRNSKIGVRVIRADKNRSVTAKSIIGRHNTGKVFLCIGPEKVLFYW